MPLDRRRFCRNGLAATTGIGLAAFCRRAGALLGKFGLIDVDAFERARVLRQANGYLTTAPETIVMFHSPRSAGGLHDYFSEGEYWWPDPDRPNGPYIRHDGMTNPDNFVAHRDVMVKMSLVVPALVAAWKLTGQTRYAERAADHLRAWFIDPATRMNPNLEYAQAVFGVNKGRGVGIIDTIHLVEPVRAAGLIVDTGVFSPAEILKLRTWFSDYTAWMTRSANGIEERDAKNNHGSCWVLQVAAFAQFTGDAKLLDLCRDRFRTTLIPDQIAPNGSLPLELARTRPYSYALFDLDILSTIAQILSTPQDSLFAFSLPDGRGLRKAVAFMEPFIADKQIWPYPYDMQYFDALPVRQPSLLFSGLAYSNAGYIALWKSLNPDPKVGEILRSFPIRQPVLWV